LLDNFDDGRIKEESDNAPEEDHGMNLGI